MVKSIFYKEWIKTRWYLLAAALVIAVMTGVTLLQLGKTVEIRGRDLVWRMLILKDTVLVESLRFIPLVVGALLATVQFIPEITHKQLKLTLHLPYPQKRMVLMMYLWGIVALLVLFLLQGGALAGVFRSWVAPELVRRVIATTLPWYLAGLAAYLWVAAICLEPTWKYRILLLLILAGVVYLLFLSSVPEAYNGILAALAVYVALGQVLVFHSIARFKEGAQD